VIRWPPAGLGWVHPAGTGKVMLNWLGKVRLGKVRLGKVLKLQ